MDHNNEILDFPIFPAAGPSEDSTLSSVTKPYSILMDASTRAQELVATAYIRLLSIQAATGNENPDAGWAASCLSLLYDASECIVDAHRRAEEIILGD